MHLVEQVANNAYVIGDHPHACADLRYIGAGREIDNGVFLAQLGNDGVGILDNMPVPRRGAEVRSQRFRFSSPMPISRS